MIDTKLKINNKNLFPELRFPDFKEPWQRKKLNEVFKEITETIGDRNIETYSVTAGKGFVSQKEKFGKNISGQQNSKYIVLGSNDFSYNKGNSKTYKCGCIYLNTEDRKIAVPNVFISFRLIDKNNDAFYFSKLFESHYLDIGLRKIISSTSRADGLLNVNKKNFFNLEIMLPSQPEQKKISIFLSTIDKWIENLYNQKVFLQEYKKSIAQKIFSQEIRFKDDDGNSFDDWKWNKLSDICTIKTGKKDVNEGNPKGAYPFFTCAKKPTYCDSYSFDCEAILIAGNGEVGHCQKYSGKFEAYQRTYVLSNFMCNSDYLFAFLNSFFQIYVNSKKQTGAMPYIKLGMLENYTIPILSLLEQQKIANFLNSIDKFIELKEKEIVKAEEWKVGLTQKLFI